MPCKVEWYDGITNEIFYYLALCQVERYDVITHEWQSCSNLQSKRIGGSAANLNDSIYVMGGNDGENYLNTVERYLDGDWVYVASMNMKRSSSAAVACGGYIYVCGGYDGVERVNTVERYDPVKDKWEFISPMVYSRGGAAVAVIEA